MILMRDITLCPFLIYNTFTMIRKDIKQFLNTLPEDITLVAATKVTSLGNVFKNSLMSFLIIMKVFYNSMSVIKRRYYLISPVGCSL